VSVGKGIKHRSVGAELTQTEWESETAHIINSGADFPTSPTNGEFFFNYLTNKLYIYLE